MRSRLRVLLSFLLVAVSFLAPTRSEAKFQWQKSLFGCEPPAVFYSSRHIAGARPCCPVVEGMCASGVECPPSGICAADGKACQPTPPAGRPNIVVMIADDQGSCQFGTAGECRSAQKGLPIPAPVTPNLDLLAGHGTVFPVAHNTASWCFPSLFSIVTGRYQRNMVGSKKPADDFGAMPRSLRLLVGDENAQPDPYDAKNSIGGYCTFLGGKLTERLGDPGFHARARTGERAIGRTHCVPGAPGQPPLCGTNAQTVYDPTAIFRGSDLFEFLDTLLYRVPGPGPATYAMQNFFAWYAPRIPHQPLRAPVVIRDYLFGSGPQYPLGGAFNLGQFCSGASCPASVNALNETVFGDVHELYGNLWWMDDSLREIRLYLERMGAPHCIANNGKSRFDVASPEACGGTWAEAITPDLARNTIIMFLADNGWHLPDSKHSFTENGTRTRLIVFDPRNLPTIPPADPAQSIPPPPQESEALAHAVDVHATALGFALGASQPVLCPEAPNGGGSRCDGLDLRAHLVTAPGGPAAPNTLRKSMCGHQTQKPTVPTKNRYLVTGPGAVGRCTNTAAAACVNDAGCASNQFCLGGRCAPKGDQSCTTSTTCPSGAVCLGNKCRMAPPCLQDSDCSALFPGGSYSCVAKEQKWCRNDPSVACSTNGDCPACGPGEAACKRLCEPQRLKFYVNAGASIPELADLFTDPDEVGLHKGGPGDTTLVYQMSQLGGAYGDAIRRANCCIDEWWPDQASLGTKCSVGYSCPAELSCTQ